jgi:hypothetical protein
MRLCAGRERGCLFMAHANPLDVLAGANRIRDAIERIARDSVNSLNVRFQQNVYQQVSYSLCHGHSSPEPGCIPELAFLLQLEAKRMKTSHLQR